MKVGLSVCGGSIGSQTRFPSPVERSVAMTARCNALIHHPPTLTPPLDAYRWPIIPTVVIPALQREYIPCLLR